jgi:hypothetical protein
VALAAGSSPVIRGCVSKTSRVLFIEAHCGSNQTAISWDKAGQPGPPGPDAPANGYTATFSGHEPFGREDTAVGKTITLTRTGSYVVSGFVIAESARSADGAELTCSLVSGHAHLDVESVAALGKDNPTQIPVSGSGPFQSGARLGSRAGP